MFGAKYFSGLEVSTHFEQGPLKKQSTCFVHIKLPMRDTCSCRYHTVFSTSGVLPENTASGTKIHNSWCFYLWKKVEHNKRLRATLFKAKAAGVKLKKQKCKCRVIDITYLGTKLTQQGCVQREHSKVRTINNDTAPEGDKRFLEMGNSKLCREIHSLSAWNSNQKMLSCKNAQCTWDANKESEKLKE